MPLSNQQTFVHIELLFLVENVSYCLVFNQSILYGRSENISFVKNIAVNECMCADIIYFDRHQFRRHSLAVEENDFFTVVQCSQGVLCIVQERPKIISSS